MDGMTGRDRAAMLHELLAEYPEARVSAHSTAGLVIAVPPGVPLLATHSTGASLSLRAWRPEDRPLVIAAFETAREQGSSSLTARLVNDPTVACKLYLLDVREAYGAVITVAVGEFEGVAAQRLAEVDQSSAAPRLARITKSDLAVIVAVDEATTSILGWTEEEMVGHRSLEFIHPDDHGLAVDNWLELLATPGPSRRVRLRHKARGGAWIWFESTNNNLLHQEEQIVQCEMVDISKEMAAQELLSRLTQALPLGVFQLDADWDIVYCNSRLLDMLDVPVAESVHDLLLLADEISRAAIEGAVESVLRDCADRDLEVELRPPGLDAPRHYQLNLRSLTRQHGDAMGAIGCLADVTESVVLRRELELRATFDELTGCRNRSAINAELQTLLEASNVVATGVGVFFIDLDRFKAVNDSLGHAAGDQLLTVVAERLRGVAGHHDRVGRLGGDEFLLVCSRLTDEAAALALGCRVAATLAEPVELMTGSLAVRASIGVAWTRPGDLDEETLVSRADAAMYASKRQGSGQPVLYTEQLNDASDAIPLPVPRPSPRSRGPIRAVESQAARAG